VPTSPNDTVVAGIGASITDGAGNVWTIGSDARIRVNNIVDSTTADVDVLAFYNGLVWQKNADNHWYSKTSPTHAWVNGPSGTPPIPIPHVSPDAAGLGPDPGTIPAGSSATLVDANGNVWGLQNIGNGRGYQVTIDGSVDPTTKNVVQLTKVNGGIWQQNTADLWYSKTTPASPWTEGVATDPINGAVEPVSLTYTGGPFNSTFLASDPNNWSPAVAPQFGDALLMHPVDINSGSMSVTNNALAGTTLEVIVDPSIYSADITMDSASTISLTAHTFNGFMSVQGGTMNFIGDSTFNGAGQFLTNTNFTGTGTLNLEDNLSAIDPGESMEVGGPVGSGLTFNVVGSTGFQLIDLRLDDPTSFQGLINLAQAGNDLDSVGFVGIQATSGKLHNGILQLFSGGSVVDSTRLSGTNGSGLELQVTPVGTFLTQTVNPHIQGTVIPFTTT